MTDPMISEPGAQDDFWWFIAETADGRTHVYEVGFPVIRQDENGIKTAEVMPESRHAEILAELGPTVNFAQMAPGRPNRWLHPKAWDEKGNLLPIWPLPGVTYHPQPGRGDPMEG